MVIDSINDIDMEIPSSPLGPICAYHLSETASPVADCQGHFKISSAESIFNHWQPGQIYLHQVSYTQNAIITSSEQGHHDGVSSFIFDELIMVKELTCLQSWQLDNRASLLSLLESQFMTDFNAAFFSDKASLLSAILAIADTELAMDYIYQAQIETEQLMRCLTAKHVELVKLMLRSGFTEENFCLRELSSVNWNELANDVDDNEWNSLRMELNLSDALVELLREFYSVSNPPETERLSAMMVSLSVVEQLPWQYYLSKVERITLPAGLLYMLFRRKQLAEFSAILKHPNINIECGKGVQSCDYLIERLAVYQHIELLKILETALGGFTQEQNLLCVSCLNAAGVPSSQIVPFRNLKHDDILNWQHQRSDGTLKGAAQGGFLLLSEMLLTSKTFTDSELDAALLQAAEHGYLEIVKLIHSYGGSLEAGGRWPIKYANRYDYQQLKLYLLEQGQEDLHFMR